VDRVVVFTDAAISDLRRVALYSNSMFGSRHRARFLQSLRTDIEGLRVFPDLGALYEHGLRRLRHVVHYVYYRYDGNTETITIVRVLHESQDPSLHLPENDE
jgi:plasmid stabilization system protein ParE